MESEDAHRAQIAFNFHSHALISSFIDVKNLFRYFRPQAQALANMTTYVLLCVYCLGNLS